MRKEHKDIQHWIIDKYAKYFVVNAEVNGQNRLPNKELHWYQPDVLLKSKTGNIEFIIEVENDPTRKAIVGASILADATIKALNNILKPILMFVVYTKEGIHQIDNFKSKIDIVLPYCTNLKSIKVFAINEFKKTNLIKRC
jgi:hypothetical protein